MKKALLGVLVLGLLVAAEEKKPDDLKAKLAGVWTLTAIEIGGKKAPDEAINGQTLTFEGDKAIHKEKDKVEPATYKLNDAKKPVELDVTPTEGPEKDMVVKFILQLDGDTLKIGGKMKPTERPASFEDKDIMIMTLKRVKK